MDDPYSRAIPFAKWMANNQALLNVRYWDECARHEDDDSLCRALMDLVDLNGERWAWEALEAMKDAALWEIYVNPYMGMRIEDYWRPSGYIPPPLRKWIDDPASEPDKGTVCRNRHLAETIAMLRQEFGLTATRTIAKGTETSRKGGSACDAVGEAVGMNKYNTIEGIWNRWNTPYKDARLTHSRHVALASDYIWHGMPSAYWSPLKCVVHGFGASLRLLP